MSAPPSTRSVTSTSWPTFACPGASQLTLGAPETLDGMRTGFGGGAGGKSSGAAVDAESGAGADSGAAPAALKSTAPPLEPVFAGAPLPFPPATLTEPMGALRTLDSVPYQNSVVSAAGRGCVRMMRGVMDNTISLLSAESR